MTIQPWKKVDRFGLLSALVDLSQSPGLLVVVGDEDSDRTTAADVAEDFFQSDLQREVIRIQQSASRATTTHQVLARAWAAVDDITDPLNIPRSLSQARHLGESEIIAEIGQACGRRSTGTVFVFDTVDPLDRMPREHLRFFRDLVRASERSVVLFSRAESGTETPLHCRSINLGPVPIAEVRMSLKTASDFQKYEDRDIDQLIADLEEIATDGHLVAYEAYALLQDRLEGLAKRAI